VGNCIVMRAMKDFYPAAYDEFWNWVDLQRVTIPQGVCAGLDDAGFEALYQASIVHAKPLTNALGPDFKQVLTPERVRRLFEQM
jgi:3-deoxy-alpha-D-manno-octulosonate 8-oxidase